MPATATTAVMRAALGGASLGTVQALAAYEAHLAALDAELEEAEALFRATRTTSEIGAAACVPWRAGTPRGPGDGLATGRRCSECEQVADLAT